MKNKKRTRTCLLISLGVVGVLALIFFGSRFLYLRVRANLVPPQILIHRPFNNQIISPASGSFLHATARSKAGIRRIEVWADGEFIYAQEAPESGVISPLVLHTFWQPNGVGLHEIIVRAYDANDIKGIASVLVEAEESAAEEADSFDSTSIIEAGVYPEDAESSSASPYSGGSSFSGESADYTPSDPAPPPPEDEPPPEPLLQMFAFSLFEVFDFLDLGDDEEENLPDSSGPLQLKLEALELNTYADYGGVHCYVGVGGSTPTWYPDRDNNQDTDEEFESLGSGMWNIADYMADDNGVAIYWPGGDPLPFEINCTGSAGDGTEAIDLGVVEMEIPPGEWDGITRQVDAEGEGSFTLSYRISMEAPIPIILRPDWPVPFNVHIDEERRELQWEWERTEDFVGVNPNFLVFANDILVFQTHYLTREIRLPDVWFNPPCDVTYAFTVVAYHPPYPEGDYSYPSLPARLPDPDDGPRTDCQPEFLVSFDTLVTGDLGGDPGIDNNWSNMVRPVTGRFFGNRRAVRFSDVTLYPDRTYNISELVGSSGSSHFIYEAQEGENLRIGFRLIDHDGSSAQRLCTNYVYHDYSYSSLMEIGHFEETLYSEEGRGTGERCQVHYTIQSVSGSASGTETAIPLPWIDVTDIREDPATGFVQVDVKNTGSAEWADHRLTLGIYNRETDTRIRNHSEDLFLDIGQEETITTDYTAGNLGNICIVVDPDEAVVELYESTGALYHIYTPYCLPLPDLFIHKIQYNAEDNILQIEVHNQGDSTSNLGPSSQVDVYDLTVRLEPDSGAPHIDSIPRLFRHDVLEHHDSTWIEWPLTSEQRERLQDGYTITLDPENDMVEIDESNNSYHVEGGKNLRVTWDGIEARWYPTKWYHSCSSYDRSAHDTVVWVDVIARTELSDRALGSWAWDGSIGGDYRIDEASSRHSWNTQNYMSDFYINGEEDLVIYLRGNQEGERIGASERYFYNFNDWRIMEVIPASAADCDEPRLDDSGYSNVGYSVTARPSDPEQSSCGEWGVYVNICEVRSEP
jgi:hypothetical protein